MAPDAPAPLRAALAVGLVAGCTLALQVLLTRVLSAVLAYHFGFWRSRWRCWAWARARSPSTCAAAGSRGRSRRCSRAGPPCSRSLLALVPIALVRLDYSSGIGASLSAEFVLNLALVCVLAALPFLAAGVAIALAVRGYARSIGRVYAFDLGGAALGALAVVPLLWVVSGTTLLVGLSLVAAAAALLFAAGRAGVAARAPPCSPRLATLLAATTDLYELPPHTTARRRRAAGERPLDAAHPRARVPAARQRQDRAALLRPHLRARGRCDGRATRSPTGASSRSARRASATSSRAPGARS